MDIVIISMAAFGAALLTFFSGFGLGTLLLPVFVVFVPPQLAVALTALVHFLNNIFKLFLIGKQAALWVVVCFGIPAIVAAFLGAKCLDTVSHLEPIVQYTIGPVTKTITPLKLLIGLMIVVFALFELLPVSGWKKRPLTFRYLPLGGILSGFFGGISGHQGAFRSFFLLRVGLCKASFVATGVTIGCLVDCMRLAVYGVHFSANALNHTFGLLLCATLFALLGSLVGRHMLEKTTITTIQRIVGSLLCVLGISLAVGLI